MTNTLRRRHLARTFHDYAPAAVVHPHVSSHPAAFGRPGVRGCVIAGVGGLLSTILTINAVDNRR
jgi:hypothetical protein